MIGNGNDNGAGGEPGTHDGHASCVPEDFGAAGFGGGMPPEQTAGNTAAMAANRLRAINGAAPPGAGPVVPVATR